MPSCTRKWVKKLTMAKEIDKLLHCHFRLTTSIQTKTLISPYQKLVTDCVKVGKTVVGIIGNIIRNNNVSSNR